MNGSKTMRYLGSFMVLFFSMSLLFAEEQENNEELPSMAFLEFLGEWETDQGEWIDPIELEDEEFARLIETSIETDNEK